MKAIKGNKLYRVDETSKKAYLSQGFDIYEDSGKLLEKSPTATVPYSEYAALKAENEKLKADKTKK